MEQKLENKAWYRFVKVTFIILFLSGLALIIFVAVDGNFPPYLDVNLDKTTIQCDYGNKSMFTAQEAGIYFQPDDITSDGVNLSDYQVERLLSRCNITAQGFLNILKIDKNARLTTINPIVEEIGGLKGFGNDFGLGVLILVVIAEIVRGVFLYIFSGHYPVPLVFKLLSKW